MPLEISSKLSLPDDAVTWVISYVAKRGAGKTYDAAVQAEEMAKQKIPLIVIDGMGIWWGLRVSAKGTGEGLPVVVFGGEHADLPLNPDKIPLMVKAIVESNISCVIDLGAYAKYTARKIVATFLNELYRLNRAERHVFIEEADLWAPQRPIGTEEALCLSAVDNFVRRGGNHNLGCTLITQRSAVLNKDILTQSDCLVILRTLAPQDKKAIQAWVEEQTDEDRSKLKKWYDSLKELENGEAWVWHPEKPPIFEKVKFRHRETFHATREFIRSPQSSKINLMDVNLFIEKFRAVFEPKPIEQPKPQVSVLQVSRPQSIFPPIQNPAPAETPSSSVLPADSHETTFMPETVTTPQSLPNIMIQQLKPTLNLTVEIFDQPTTPLGRVVVVLKNNAQTGDRQDAWSSNRIKKHIREHSWGEEGVDEAIEQLIRWEILRRQSNGMLKFFQQRVQISESNNQVQVQ